MAKDTSQNTQEGQALLLDQNVYRTIVENSPEPIYVCDLQGRYLMVNHAAARNLGLTPEQLLGKTSQDLFPAHANERFMQALDRIGLSGQGEHFEDEVEVEGQTKVYRASLGPIFDAQGQVCLIHAIVHDLSEFRKTEKLLRRNEALLMASLQVADLGVFEHDHIADTFFSSPRQLEIYGFDANEKISLESYLNLHHPDDSERVELSIHNAHDTTSDGMFQIMFRIIRRDGSVRWISSRSKTYFGGEGAQRYPIRTLGINRDVTEEQVAIEERKRIEIQLRESQAHLEEAQRIAKVGSWTWDLATNRREWSKTQFMILGLDPEAPIPSVQAQESRYTPASQALLQEVLSNVIRTGKPGVVEVEYLNGNAPSTWLETRGEAVLNAEGKVIGLRGTSLDITETKSMQLKLLQAQKMESVGLLAGGIAHDFNNLLTVIQGYLELASMDLDPGDPVQNFLNEIKKASGSAATLTEQLLAFSRKQIIAPTVLNINEVVLRSVQLLQRLMGEDIELATMLSEDIYPVKFDPGQAEQIIMNLAVNARDAMKNGGKLTLETSNVYLDADYAIHHVGVTPGDYVMLAVSDNGSGIPEDVIKHIFDPFYTTKTAGKGTGLGLSMVYGAVKQNGGSIWLYSELGHGSTFRIYLPRVDDGTTVPQSRPTTKSIPHGSETIILVEDDEQVREVAMLQLQSLGYTVYEFADGESALAGVAFIQEPLDLLITDVIMPGINGAVLRDRILQLKPDLRVLFASGYTANVIVHHGVLKDGVEFLAKPFTMSSLAQRVRELLDKPPAQIARGSGAGPE